MGGGRRGRECKIQNKAHGTFHPINTSAMYTLHIELTQLVGGRLAEVYGVKLVYGVSLAGTAVLSLLSPAVAREAGSGFRSVKNLFVRISSIVTK